MQNRSHFTSKCMALVLLLFVSVSAAIAQTPQTYPAAKIQQMLHKLNRLGSILYVAAHPDDENTRLIAYMANEELMHTTYLSLTRGDGGQNLIGTEKSELMGLIRTHELLEARKIDGGQQRFTRAVDFGYSKSAEETLNIWDKDKVLADVVWAIRKYRPDVIITRFPPTKRAGHGHHTASALLAEEAFKIAGDAKYFPEHLKHVEVWQPKSIYHNTSTWWYDDLPELAKNSDEYATFDIGAYNPLLGKSYGEISAESRSMHKSQGFGSSKRRGSQTEYVKHVDGEVLGKDFFSSFDLTWKRVPGAEKVSALLAEAAKNFDPANPGASVANLAKAYDLLNAMKASHYVTLKKQDIKEAITACAGLWLEVSADKHTYAYGNEAKLNLTAINRSGANFKLKDIKIGTQSLGLVMEGLTNNNPITTEHSTKVGTTSSNPYWLNKPFQALFKVDEQTLIGNPENEAAVQATFMLEVEGVAIEFQRPVIYKWTDRVKGELYRPLAIVPPVTANLGDKVYIFADETSLPIEVTVRNNKDASKGKVTLKLPKGWSAATASIPYNLEGQGAEAILKFMVTPPANAAEGKVGLSIQVDGDEMIYHQAMTVIDYDHIPTQTLLPTANSKIVRLDIQTQGKHIGYVMGAGDEVPASLQQIGYTVTPLPASAIPTTDLTQFDAIVMGIRAYNTEKPLQFNNKLLLEYVNQGGTMVVQYNTNRGLVTPDLGPFPLKLSRDRVTLENAPVKLLAKDHPILNTPNKITEADFDAWVQERGLYFANEWDKQYTPLLAWNDPGETSKEGSLLAATYGKGAFVLTGISFFRQLPAGVPGAYRLFANIIAFGQGQTK